MFWLKLVSRNFTFSWVYTFKKLIFSCKNGTVFQCFPDVLARFRQLFENFMGTYPWVRMFSIDLLQDFRCAKSGHFSWKSWTSWCFCAHFGPAYLSSIPISSELCALHFLMHYILSSLRFMSFTSFALDLSSLRSQLSLHFVRSISLELASLAIISSSLRSQFLVAHFVRLIS